ncbi:MAG: hypothetical protein HQ567_16950, partial [Candidatus Nealsonbacteria bacterium]|nr:hypothetical protein [Candidatus Nealsonbacteria bacterium]
MRNINVLLTMLAVLLFTATAHADLVGLGLNTTYGSIVYNSDDSITLSETGGHDFWGNNDRGFLAYEAMPVSGDGEIIARLKYDTSGGGWSRIGIDWRESLAPNAARFGADLADSNGGKIENSHRNNTGNNMERDGDVNNQTLDWNWVRVTREGNVFQAYRSPDGSDWTAYGAASTINFAGAEGYVGIFAHGRNNNSFTTATFSNLGGFLTQADGDLNSIGSGFWDVAATWNGTVVGGVPTDMSLVTIDDTLGLPDVVTVRDMTSIAKRLTIQDASSLAIQAGQLLTVDGTVTATGTGPIAFGTGAQLVANGGGSIATVTTTGDNTLNTGGAMSVATWTDSATAGTLTKAGDGRLTLDNSGGTIDLDNTTVRISGGTLAFQDGLDPLGGAVLPVQLDGGTFSIEGVVGTAEGVVNYGLYNGASNNANLTDIADGAVNGQNGGLCALTPTETSAGGG